MKPWNVTSMRKILQDISLMLDDVPLPERKIEVTRTGRKIKARFYYEPHKDAPSWHATCPSESDMVEIAQWCQETNCGKRTSFDTFEFKSKEEFMLFAMRWQ